MNMKPVAAVIIGLLLFSPEAHATYCENAQCFEGIDPSGRGPKAMKESAQEILDHAKAYSPEMLSTARKALRDADNPAMYDHVAVECNKPGVVQNFDECVRQGHAKNHISEPPKFQGTLHYTIRRTIMWRSPDGPVQAMRDHNAGTPDSQVRSRWVSCVLPEGSEFTSDFGDPNYLMYRGGENTGVCANKSGWVSFQDAP